MIIEKYGVVLERLIEDKIEMVRFWRNSPHVSMHMEYRNIITPEMQKRWFDSINNEYNYYFIMNFKGKDIGLINIKDIDYYNKIGESGIFIFDESYLNTVVPVRFTLAICDFAFDVLLLDNIITHVLSDNKRAISYNKFFGSVIAPNQENVYNQKYIRTKDSYYIKRQKIQKNLSHII